MAQSKRAFTLIETVLVIVILAITLTPVSVLLVNVMQGNARPQAWVTAVGLGQGEMERVCAIQFSDIANVSQTVFASPFSAYSYQIIAENVASNALNTPTASATNYKRLRVIVSNPLAGNVTLTTVVANDW